MIPGTRIPNTRTVERSRGTFKNILVAITKRNAKSALGMAAQVATPGVSRVRLLHLQERLTYPVRAGHVVLETYDEAVDFASRLQGELLELGVNSEIEVGREVSGHEAEQILLAAYNFKADLIICGNHRKSGLEAMLRGSTTGDLVRKSALTLLLVPESRLRGGS